MGGQMSLVVKSFLAGTAIVRKGEKSCHCAVEIEVVLLEVNNNFLRVGLTESKKLLYYH